MSNLKTFVIDVDGVMTTGQFVYTLDGKVAKVFGAHDHDGLKLIDNLIKIEFITADTLGFQITHKRIVEDMGYNLTVVSSENREKFIENFGFNSTVFMGDGYHDAPILRKCAIGIAPKNARDEAKYAASFVTPSNSAEGAVMDACLFLNNILSVNDSTFDNCSSTTSTKFFY